MRKNQRGEFLIASALLLALFSVFTIYGHKTAADRAEDLQAKTQQVQEQKQ